MLCKGGEEEEKGAVPSRQQGSNGVVTEAISIEEEIVIVSTAYKSDILGEVGEDDEEKDGIGAVPCRQHGYKYGMAIKDENEKSEVNDGNTAVLSSRQLNGVVPVDRRKRKVSES